MAEIISTHDDLLTIIFVGLPPRTLLRFRSVSKHWKTLLTDSYFMCRHFKLRQAFPYLLLRNYRHGRHRFIPLCDDHLEQIPPFAVYPHLRISQSCNGLLLCTTPSEDFRHIYHHVYNPTTSQFTTILTDHLIISTRRWDLTLHGNWSLAFDPIKSPHYQIVYCSKSKSQPLKYWIAIYSSQTRRWQVHTKPFIADYEGQLCNEGIYSNGAVHWIQTRKQELVSKYFNIEENRIATMPMLPELKQLDIINRPYVKAWKDHLYLVNMYNPPETKFEVYKLERDYSRWCMNYQINVPSNFKQCEVYPLLIVSGKGEDDSYMILQFGDDALVRYNVNDETFYQLDTYIPKFGTLRDVSESIPYIESLYPV